MYAQLTQGYSNDATQGDKGFLDYLPFGNGRNFADATDSISPLGYLTHFSQEEVTQGTQGFIDYILLDSFGYYQDSVQQDKGKLDYIIGANGYYSEVIIYQPSGWSVNWELISILWNEEDNFIFNTNG